MNFDEPLASFAESYTISRKTPGQYVTGIWVDGAGVSTFLTRLVVQPTSGKSLQILPEGKRAKETLWVASTVELIVASQANGQNGDRFAYDGRNWEIQNRQNWTPGAPLPHLEYFAQLVEQDT